MTTTLLIGSTAGFVCWVVLSRLEVMALRREIARIKEFLEEDSKPPTKREVCDECEGLGRYGSSVFSGGCDLCKGRGWLERVVLGEEPAP